MCGDLQQYIVFSPSLLMDEQNRLEEQLSLALPSDYKKLTSDSMIEAQSNKFHPPGKCIRKFEVDGDEFEIWLTKYSDDGASTVLSKAEKIAIWFIESADR